MYGVRHSLANDFPELSQLIDELRSRDREFARLMDEYHRTDKKIYGFEIQQRPVADGYVEQLKRSRLRLKDQLYRILQSQRRANGAGMPASVGGM